MHDFLFFYFFQGNYSYTLQIFQAEHLFQAKAIFGKHYGYDALKSASFALCGLHLVALMKMIQLRTSDFLGHNDKMKESWSLLHQFTDVVLLVSGTRGTWVWLCLFYVPLEPTSVNNVTKAGRNSSSLLWFAWPELRPNSQLILL